MMKVSEEKSELRIDQGCIDIASLNVSFIRLDEEEESSTEEDESNVEDIKLRLGDKVTVPDKVSAAKETEAGAEISALVNYVQPVHFNSFESAESA